MSWMNVQKQFVLVLRSNMTTWGFLFRNTRPLKCRNFQHFCRWANLAYQLYFLWYKSSFVLSLNDNEYFRLMWNLFFWDIGFTLLMSSTKLLNFQRQKENFTAGDERPQTRLYIYIDRHQDQTVCKPWQSSWLPSSSSSSLSPSPSSPSLSSSSSSSWPAYPHDYGECPWPNSLESVARWLKLDWLLTTDTSSSTSAIL